MKTIIKNGIAVLNGIAQYAEIAFKDGIIVDINSHVDEDIDDSIIDAQGRYVLPGAIDSHVHYGIDQSADSFGTGSKAAVFGGITTVIDYVSPIHGKQFSDAFKKRLTDAEGHSYVDYTFHCEVLGWNGWNDSILNFVNKSGMNSLKVYTTYGQDQLSYKEIESLMKAAKNYNLFVMVHAEDDNIIQNTKERMMINKKTAPMFHSVSRPEDAEITAVKQLLEIAGRTGAHIHFAHVSTGKAAQLIAEGRSHGIIATAETCPHYLLLNDSIYLKDNAQLAIMTPPLRTERDNAELWKKLREGTIDSIVTDHCAYSRKEKLSKNTCFDTLPGISGSETMVPLIYSEGVRKKRITMAQMVEKVSVNPAKLYGIYPKKGILAVGSDADITILDQYKTKIIDGEKLHSASLYSAFNGMEVTGWPIMTILRGKTLCCNESLLVNKPGGEYVFKIG